MKRCKSERYDEIVGFYTVKSFSVTYKCPVNLLHLLCVYKMDTTKPIKKISQRTGKKIPFQTDFSILTGMLSVIIVLLSFHREHEFRHSVLGCIPL